MKTVIEMAREAGGMDDHMMWLNRDLLPVYERIVDLARADERKKWEDQTAVEINEAVLDEREACARVCEQWAAGVHIAEDIRARGDK